MKKMLLTLAIATISTLALAGSCNDCYTTYKEELKQCSDGGGGDTCRQRAKEKYNQCTVGC
jgi:ABC-type oligopeptide transport system substrate-binding subunit